VDSALIYRKLLEENRNLKRQLGSAVSSDWIGRTEQSRGVRQSIATAAFATGSVAFIGEGVRDVVSLRSSYTAMAPIRAEPFFRWM
jgi:hypothetical protein